MSITLGISSCSVCGGQFMPQNNITNQNYNKKMCKVCNIWFSDKFKKEMIDNYKDEEKGKHYQKQQGR